VRSARRRPPPCRPSLCASASILQALSDRPRAVLARARDAAWPRLVVWSGIARDDTAPETGRGSADSPRPRSAPTTAQAWIDALALTPHPEGGWFRETYRAAESLAHDHLPLRFGGPRAFSTAIYFLLRHGEFSALHRIRSDEVWHLYAGGPLNLALLHPDGRAQVVRLGMDVARGEAPQAMVPAGCWYGAWLDDGVPFALTGGTVAPGFDFADFELGTRRDLVERFPQQRALVERLTHPQG
jgi:predicted cupin superfamily sugar epimerase